MCSAIAMTAAKSSSVAEVATEAADVVAGGAVVAGVAAADTEAETTSATGAGEVASAMDLI